MASYVFLPSADLSYDSGSVMFAKQLANALSAKGSDVRILASRAPVGYALDSRVKVHVDERLLEHPIVTDRQIGNEELNLNESLCRQFLMSMHSERAIDLIYAQYLSFTSAAATDFGEVYRIPVVVSSFGRDIEVGISSDSRIRDFAERSLPNIDTLVVPTEAVARRAAALAAATHKSLPNILIVPPPIDEEFISAQTQDVLFPVGCPAIATINSCFKPDKGIETILEAVARLKIEGYPKMRLIVAGTDDHPGNANKKRLDLQVLHLDLADNVSFVGYLSRSLVKALLCQADVFVDARYTSGFSSVLVEALACSAAICCSRNEAALTFVKADKTALLFDAGNADQLLAHLHSLASNERLRSTLQKNAGDWFAKEGKSLVSENAMLPMTNMFSRTVSDRGSSSSFAHLIPR